MNVARSLAFVALLLSAVAMIASYAFVRSWSVGPSDHTMGVEAIITAGLVGLVLGGLSAVSLWLARRGTIVGSIVCASLVIFVCVAPWVALAVTLAAERGRPVP